MVFSLNVAYRFVLNILQVMVKEHS